jgi:predicted transposase YdaD
MPLQNIENTDYDNPWKSFIELYFRDFLRLFFPAIEADIDWSKPIRFLDKELQKIVRDGEIPKRYADKLVEVYRLNGEKTLVICHIEVQSQEEGNFAVRMYSYNYRLRDRYNCPVVSLAILGDENNNWRPSVFQDDYLKTKATHNKPSERKNWKLQLVTMLYDRGYGEQAILELNNFLDWMMNLPEDLEREFQTDLKAFEEAREMKYVTTIERMGIEQGREEEKKAIALNMLKDNISLEQISRFTGLQIEQIQELQAQMN